MEQMFEKWRTHDGHEGTKHYHMEILDSIKLTDSVMRLGIGHMEGSEGFISWHCNLF